MKIITLDLFGKTDYLIYDTDFIIVNDKPVTDINVALKAGVISEDDIEDVFTAWQITVDEVNHYVNSKNFNITADIDELHSVVYLYVPDDEVSFFEDEFWWIDTISIDTYDYGYIGGCGCCGDYPDYDE